MLFLFVYVCFYMHHITFHIDFNSKQVTGLIRCALITRICDDSIGKDVTNEIKSNIQNVLMWPKQYSETSFLLKTA